MHLNIPKLRVEGPIPFTRSNFFHTLSIAYGQYGVAPGSSVAR